MSRKEGSREEIRREVREALKTVRKEVEKVRKDLATATQNWMKTTEKFVQDVSPKVSSTLSDALGKTSVAFRNAMTTIDKKTKPQQVKLLRSYKTLLSKQVEYIEKRLKELTK